jgi:uroporphyrinogen-III decarboxylase
MTPRERFRRALSFERADRQPVIEWATWWDKTVERWLSEGLEIPEEAPFTQCDQIKRALGLDLDMQFWMDPIPESAPKPARHGAPLVESLADYEALKPLLYPEEPFDRARLEAAAALQQRGDAILWTTVVGPFWGPRALLGIENHLYAFYDEPEFMDKINEDLLDYNLRAMDEFCRYAVPDFMTVAEDMSYNHGPMLSGALFERFLAPFYRRMLPEWKARGIRVFCDSDGDVTELIPWLEASGFDGILPLERQAGVDVAKLREAHPRFLFIGHFDKTVMRNGEGAMRREFDRLLPAMRKGGFLPSVDHQTPPDVPLETYRAYLKLYKEYAQKGVAS